MLLPQTDHNRGTLIRIGAGKSLDIEDILRAPGAPATVILIEPHPDLAKALATRLANWPAVSVLAVGLGSPQAAATDGTLRQFNDPAHASLHAPLPALLDLLPGLRQTGTLPVKVMTVTQALATSGPLPQPIHVEIDAPGAEQDILDGLGQSGILDQLNSIDLRAGSEPLYQGATSAGDLCRWLEGNGFRHGLTADDDPDWPVMRMLADWQARALRQQLDEATTRAAMQSDRIVVLESALADARKQADQSSAAFETRLAAQAQTIAVLKQSEDALKAKAALQTGRITELEAALTASATAAKTHGEHSARLTKDLTDLRQVVDLKTAGIAKRDKAAAALHTQTEAARAEFQLKIDTLTLKLAEVEKTLAEAVKTRDTLSTSLAKSEDALKANAGRTTELEAALAASTTAAKTHGEHRTRLATELTDLRQVIAQKTDEIAKRDSAAAALHTQTEAARAEFQLKIDTQALKLAEVEKTLTEAIKTRDTQSGTLRDALAAKADVEGKLKLANDRKTALDLKIGQLDSQIAQLNDDVLRGTFDLPGTRRDLGLSLKHQSRVQAELDDLQTRFKALDTIRRDQDDLLRQLLPRLQEAARHLQTLPPMGKLAGAATRPALPKKPGKVGKKHGAEKQKARP